MADPPSTKTAVQAMDWSVAAAVAVTLLAAILRFWNIGSDALWMDEAASWRQASFGFMDMLRETAWDNYPPVHNVALFVSMRLFGDGEAAIRLPSVVFGILTVPAIFLAARELFGRLAGVVAALLVATAQFQIHYSHEARMYSAFALFAALSLYFMLLQLRRPSRLTAIAFVLATATMLYTHFYSLLTLAAEGVFIAGLLLFRRAAFRRWVRWFALFALATALYLPWVRFLVRQTLHVQKGFWTHEPTVEETLEYFRTFAGSTNLVLAELALVLVALILVLRPPRLDLPTAPASGIALHYGERVALMALWILLPILLAFGLSFALEPFLVLRYVIAASLAWYILAAAGFAIVGRENLPAAVVLAVIFVLSQAAVLNAFYRTPQRADWRSAVAYILANKRPGDVALANPVGNRGPLRYYSRHDPLPVAVYHGYQFAIAETAERVWLLTDMYDECISGKPGTLAATRPLLDRKDYYRASVCLYGASTAPAR
jgi:mannosyltransferase